MPYKPYNEKFRISADKPRGVQVEMISDYIEKQKMREREEKR